MRKAPKKTTLVWGIILGALGLSSLMAKRPADVPANAMIITGIILLGCGCLLIFFYIRNKIKYNAVLKEAEKILGFSPKIGENGFIRGDGYMSQNGNIDNTATTFCTNCGERIEAAARFCPSCGAPNQSIYGAGNPAQTDAEGYSGRKQEFVGKIFKCPNCGELIQSFQTHCPSCGLEFRSVRATSAVREFALKLETIEANREYEKPKGLFSKTDAQSRISKADEQKISLIQSFAIPNTKEDLLEFMILARTNINLRAYDSYNTRTSKAEKAINDAWMAKVTQVYNKAKQSYQFEREFTEIQRLYEECQDSIKKAKKTGIIKWAVLIGWLPVALIIILIIVNGFVVPKQNSKEEQRLAAIVEEIESAIDEKDYTLALRHAESIEYKGGDSERERWWNIKKEDLIDEIIERAEQEGIHLERTPEVETEEETTKSGKEKLDEEWNNLKDTINGLKDQKEENPEQP